MGDLMGSFFLIFGTFKIINLEGFVEAYSMYDVIAKKSKFYAYMYPFLEITLGILYVMGFYSRILNIVTLFLMVISAIGVFNELQKKRAIPCACLGVLFKIPMTYVTLLEDILMAVMAFIMIFI